MAGNSNDRDTRNLDPTELAKLARESVDAVEPVAATISESRTATVQDPLTMALLAEVARNAQTQEFDPAEMPKSESEPLAHPNLKRR
ncbi:MAG: hypothetical protein ABI591_22560 [Kofleriaceae bacterium]